MFQLTPNFLFIKKAKDEVFVNRKEADDVSDVIGMVRSSLVKALTFRIDPTFVDKGP